jgi:UDP:flavonoid glycosyltransferase YjiC (YdhE family)
MARIVFASELGSSSDRLRRLLPIAEQLQADGNSVAFVVADVIAANTLLKPKGIQFVCAPRPLPAHRPANHGQILAALGEDDRIALQARVRAWINLFDLLAADAIVIDRAPSALLAARISQRSVRLIDQAEVLTPHHLMSLANDRRASYRVSDRRRILYAWELGTNAGHLERGLAIAEGLRDRGHDVIFVVSDLVLAERLLASRGFDFIPTPHTPLRPTRRPTVNFSDVLLTCGFADAVALDARVRAWTHLLHHLDPDAIVIDHAPTAQLAAYIANLPAILVNSGFAIPPLTQPLPSIQPHRRISNEQLSLADRRVLATVNDVTRRCGAQPLAHLSELFARSAHIITTFKELDPYSERDTGMHVGPLERATGHTEARWRTVGGIRVFAYLRPHINGLDTLLQTLLSCNVEVICALPGASQARMARYQSAHFEIFTEPIELGSLLKEADLVISYGGAGLLARALLAGLPLLLVPDVLEQITNSERVVALGAGILLLEDRNPAAITSALTALTSQDRYRTAARNFATKYRAGVPDARERIVAAIEQSF